MIQQTMINGKINWGIIGLGKVANRMAHDLQFAESATLYAVASRDQQKANHFKQKYLVNKQYNSYLELAEDPNIDVVYIATPHTFHFEHTMMCLQKGKAVLCEKPMGVDVNEVKRMQEEAKKRGVFLMEGLWTRFIPVTEKLIELLDQKIIGEIISIRADFGFKADYDPKHRLFNKALGGGTLLDIGIYPIYLALLILGFPLDIKATARMAPTGVDQSCSILMSHQHSAKAVLESTVEADTPTEAYIFGTKGSMKLHRRFHHSEKISVLLNGKPEQSFNIKYKGKGFIYEIEEVNQCITNNRLESKKLPHKVSLELISIIDQVKNQIGLNYQNK